MEVCVLHVRGVTVRLPKHEASERGKAGGFVLRFISLLRFSSSVGLVFDAWTIRSGIDAGILKLALLDLQDSWQNGQGGA